MRSNETPKQLIERAKQAVACDISQSDMAQAAILAHLRSGSATQEELENVTSWADSVLIDAALLWAFLSGDLRIVNCDNPKDPVFKSTKAAKATQ